jgi:hypothetical protein
MGKQADPSMGVRGPFKGWKLGFPTLTALTSRRAPSTSRRAGLRAAASDEPPRHRVPPRRAGRRVGAACYQGAPGSRRAGLAAASGPRAAGARQGAAAPRAPEAGRAHVAWSGRAAAPRVCRGVRAARGKPVPRLASRGRAWQAAAQGRRVAAPWALSRPG